MLVQHLHPARPSQFASWALPIPNLPRAVFGQESAMLNFFGNAFVH
jgi:hypothetical protein